MTVKLIIILICVLPQLVPRMERKIDVLMAKLNEAVEANKPINIVE